ncbi:MAG: hypothetical protein WCT31_04580 [Candidatus Micrarchaeia archaeon]|jgi:hypothetical protein
MKYYFLFLVLSLSIVYGSSCTPDIQWSKTFNESTWSEVHSLQQTSDGGYIVVCLSSNDNSWIKKLDNKGDIAWDKNFSNGKYTNLESIVQTTDGDFILAGYVNFKGFGAETDALLARVDSNGNTKWVKTYGGPGTEGVNSVAVTPDGGYIFAGWTFSQKNNYDYWVVKTDVNGNMQWNKSFGGSTGEEAYSIRPTSDGGYIIAGPVNSIGAGSDDAWLIKLDSNGNEQWNKTYGKSSQDGAYSVWQTSDLGYIITGITDSYNGLGGNWNAWLIKTDSLGNTQWNKIIETNSASIAHSVQQAPDGGYLVVGESYSSFGQFKRKGYAWIVKTNSEGIIEWTKNLTNSYNGAAYAFQQTSDGGYVVAGFSGPINELNRNAWITKINPCDNFCAAPFSLLIILLFSLIFISSNPVYINQE